MSQRWRLTVNVMTKNLFVDVFGRHQYEDTIIFELKFWQCLLWHAIAHFRSWFWILAGAEWELQGFLIESCTCTTMFWCCFFHIATFRCVPLAHMCERVTVLSLSISQSHYTIFSAVHWTVWSFPLKLLVRWVSVVCMLSFSYEDSTE